MIKALEAEIAGIEQSQKACREQEWRLRDAEDPGAGVQHAQDIFELGQERLRLEVEADLRRRKIRRIRLGYLPDAAC
jgi:hypothetical protein